MVEARLGHAPSQSPTKVQCPESLEPLGADRVNSPPKVSARGLACLQQETLKAWKAGTEDFLPFLSGGPEGSVGRVVAWFWHTRSRGGRLFVCLLNLHRQRPAPASGHSGPSYRLCLASIQGASWEPGPEHQALLLSSLPQTPSYPGPPLCSGNQKPPHAGAFRSSGGPQSIPTVTGGTREHFQTATCHAK